MACLALLNKIIPRVYLLEWTDPRLNNLQNLEAASTFNPVPVIQCANGNIITNIMEPAMVITCVVILVCLFAAVVMVASEHTRSNETFA